MKKLTKKQIKEYLDSPLGKYVAKKNKKEINFPCDSCGKQAVYNLQNNWHLFDIVDDEKFESNDEWEGDSNEFFCEDCYEKEMSLTN